MPYFIKQKAVVDFFLFSSSSAVSWLSQPNAETAMFGAPSMSATADLRPFTQFRLCVHQSNAGNATAKLYLKGSTDNGTTYSARLENAAGTTGDVSIASANVLTLGTWVTIDPTYRIQDARFQVFGINGNSNSPSFRNIHVQLR